ncbi:ferritin family protein [Crossiella cryophila]|uniref:Ferritin-like domain-containing protein n=1 Tax=Crossiella cryophila TaxID=43355 RepID=A0A7W7FT21_9PSEU|nr:hypothetical protein [Crossiella cryophila]MBB4676792.1 hypothetical protein [Crossiella cryophila]
MNRPIPRRLDQASLRELRWPSLREVLRHPVEVAAERPEPRELHRRWVAQTWQAGDIDLTADRRHWRRSLPERTRADLRALLPRLNLGEPTSIESLRPILVAAPDADALLYLGTQLVDEVRHRQFALRVAAELCDLPEPAPGWPAMRELQAELSGELLRHPADYRRWLRAVTLFHLVQQGVLALSGQLALVTLLGDMPGLPGVRTAFAAITRDRSRHLAFGLHALRQGVLEGHAGDIGEVVALAAAPGIAAVFGEAHPHARLAWRRLAWLLREIGLPERSGRDRLIPAGAGAHGASTIRPRKPPAASLV